ncbi:MAG: site-2 protease family protein [Anaerolineaceae bacterium]|nr:site-2 protease family protein [Anaerolineaceae bacterium]
MEITESIVRIIEFIFVIGILAFLHEFGHFIISKAFKIEVEEFGFGFPPRLVKLFTWRGTDVTLNWIPFGAFVRPKGENNPEIPGGLAAASPWARLAVLFAGPVFNLLIGAILFSFVFQQTGAPDFSKVQIMEISEPSPAYEAGLLPGDIIANINGENIDSMEKLSTLVRSNLDQEISLSFNRDDVLQTVMLTPRSEYPSDQGPIGVGITNPFEPISIGQAIPYGFMATFEQARQLFLMPGKLASGQVSSEEARVVGPVGLYGIYNNFAERDKEIQETTQSKEPIGLNVLLITAMISVAFGLTNLLPLPALDGGRILFVLPEILFRKRVPAKFENMVHFIGFSALIMLLFFITFQDIFNPVQLP